MRECVLPLVFLLTTCAASVGQESTRTIRLDRWLTKGSISLQTRGNVLRVSGRGYATTEVEYLDFVLHVKLRVVTPDAEGAVLLRGWESYRDPRTGYRVAITGAAVGRQPPLVTGFSAKTAVIPGNADRFMPPVAVGDWHQLEIACQHDHVAVRLDGAEIAVVEGHEPQAGTVGIESVKGVIEYDDIWLAPIEVPTGDLVPSPSLDPPPLRWDATGITQPRVRHSVRPRYSAQAMRSRTQGTVVLEVVVMPDGSVGQVSIVKSLKCDLDLEAVAAARRWQFAPAHRGDTAVPVLAIIELTFTLR